MNNLTANHQWEQCCLQAMTKLISGSLEQMDDDGGSLPTLFPLVHPCSSHLPTTIQTLRDQAETCVMCQGTNTNVPLQAPCLSPPSPLRTARTSTPSLAAQEAWTILPNQRNDCSLLMEPPNPTRNKEFVAPFSSFNYDSLSVTISRC